MPKSLSTSRRNDDLLRSKITGLGSYGKYMNVLRPYFERTLHSSANTQQRVKEIIRALRELWVVQAGKRRTFRIFEDFANFERLLFQRKDYRAHFAHQFNVFLLGYFILNKFEQGLLRSGRLRASFGRTSINPNFTWMLSATFHDMGYPIEQLDYWFSEFLKMFLNVDIQYRTKIEEVLTPLFFEYAKYLSEEHTKRRSRRGSYNMILPSKFKIDWKFHNTLLTRLRRKDHGVISALLLMHSLLTQEEIEKFSSDEWEWMQLTFPGAILPACHAIAIHHIEEIRISQDEYPIAFLLILCDALQDWGRSIASRDSSELVDIGIDCSRSPPEIECILRINDKEKLIELDRLENRLSANRLKVVIKQKGRKKRWEIS